MRRCGGLVVAVQEDEICPFTGVAVKREDFQFARGEHALIEEIGVHHGFSTFGQRLELAHAPGLLIVCRKIEPLAEVLVGTRFQQVDAFDVDRGAMIELHHNVPPFRWQ